MIIPRQVAQQLEKLLAQESPPHNVILVEGANAEVVKALASAG